MYVTEFYSKLKLLGEELKIYMMVPTCSCRVHCSCDAMRNAHDNYYLLHVIRFLTGLNGIFVVLKSKILLINLFFLVNKIFFMCYAGIIVS